MRSVPAHADVSSCWVMGIPFLPEKENPGAVACARIRILN
jgi:hypothetical protein